MERLEDRFVEVVSLGEPMLEFNAVAKGSLRFIDTYTRGWGGDTSNFAVAVARLGRSVGYIARIGDDEFGKCFLDMWKREGVDHSRVIVEKGGFTAIYFISLIDGGEHDFTYYRRDSAASHLSPEDLDLEYIRRAKVFHSSGISQAISESCREAVFKAAETAKKAGGKFSYDPNIRLKLWSENLAKATVNYTIEMADIVLPSMEDAKFLTGESDPKAAAEKILRRGPEIVALKLGGEGCLVYTKEEVLRVPGFPVEVVDTTGAGDAFDGAFVVGILEGWPLRKTSEFANAVGAVTTTGKGAVSPIPKREEILDFLRKKGSELWR